MKTIERRIVVAYIVSRDGMLLLGKKAPSSGGVYVDSWHNPGGGVESGESDRQALGREVLEEAGIDITTATIACVDSQGTGKAAKTLSDGTKILVKMHFLVYRVGLATTAADTPSHPGDDLAVLQWFPLDILGAINLTPPAKELFARIGTDWILTAEATT